MDAELLLGIWKRTSQCLLHLIVEVGNDHIRVSDAVLIEKFADPISEELESFQPLVVYQPKGIDTAA